MHRKCAGAPFIQGHGLTFDCRKRWLICLSQRAKQNPALKKKKKVKLANFVIINIKFEIIL